MKSINGVNWKLNNVPERLILKNKQNFNISYLLSKIFLENKYSDEEIQNSINNYSKIKITYQNEDFKHASELVIDCIKNNKKILIFGDYDVDGYSSSYILYDYFTNININCEFFIPDRFLDGYGPNIPLLKKLINNKNYGLVFFVDCGSNSIDEIMLLENFGLKTIIIDHHKIYKKNKFKNTVIINPLKKFIIDQYSYFCATSLVYFFIKYLINVLKIKKKIDLNKYLFFSAFATICDQMPLRGPNRKIIKKGLQNFSLNNFENLKRLLIINKKITSSDIGFSLGPILNSASRVGDSTLPFKLLIEKKKTRIEKISKKLINYNEKRKIAQFNTLNLLKNINSHNKNEIIFKYKKNINEGLMGIIASNFVEFYNKPCFILTDSGNLIKCSSRSIDGYDIGNIFYLAIYKKIILKGGGHSMAGGCILKKSKLNEFKNFLNSFYIKKYRNIDNINFFSSEQNFNSLLSFAKKEFQLLEPFGNGNKNPFFLIKKNKIIKTRVIKNIHLQLVIKNNYNRSCLCLAFNVVGTKLGDILMNFKKDIDLIVQINNKIIHKNTDFNLIIKDAII